MVSSAGEHTDRTRMTAPARTTTGSDDDERRRRAGGAASKTNLNGVQPRPQQDVEIGVSSHLPWQTPYEDLWEALKFDEVTVRELMTMRRTDGQARALYRLITLPIRAALKTATYLPQEGEDGGEEEALFVEQMFTLPVTGGGMKTPFGRVIAQMLMAIFDGFSAFEMVYWKPDAGPLKGKWTIKKLAHRPSEQLTFLLDDDSEFVALRQRTMYHDRQVDVKIPAEHVVYYAANQEERPYYGISYFSAAYKHWEAKFKMYVVAHIAAQRAAVGTRVGTMPSNPSREEKAEFQRSLADLGIAQWMTVPDTFKVESLKEVGAFDYLAYINHHNSQMSKSVLAAFFDDSQGTGGDASLVDFGRQSDALFLLMLQTIMGEIEEVINTQVIPKFIDWNFNSGKYPKFQFGALSEEQKGALLDLFKALSAVAPDSMAVSQEFFREVEIQIAEMFSLEVDWEAVEEREEEEARQAELAMQVPAANAATAALQAQPGHPDDAGGGSGTGAALVPSGADIDPQNVPEGFALTMDRDTMNVTLSDLAAGLLDDAVVELVRGRPNSGGPKYVRSAEGARVYGVPIGTPITRDLDRRTSHHGPKGAAYGKNHTQNPNKKAKPQPVGKQGGGGKGDGNTGRQTLGGGEGDTSGRDGSARGKPTATPQRVFTNPKEPGAQLIDYGDGTVAIRDAQGRLTPRQRYDIGLFAKFGWRVESTSAEQDTGKGADRVRSARSSKSPGRRSR